MQAEEDYTCHIFDQDLEDARIAAGMTPVPWNIISSLDATDIPFGHILFKTPEVPVMISTSAAGIPVIEEKMESEYVVIMQSLTVYQQSGATRRVAGEYIPVKLICLAHLNSEG